MVRVVCVVLMVRVVWVVRDVLVVWVWRSDYILFSMAITYTCHMTLLCYNRETSFFMAKKSFCRPCLCCEQQTLMAHQWRMSCLFSCYATPKDCCTRNVNSSEKSAFALNWILIWKRSLLFEGQIPCAVKGKPEIISLTWHEYSIRPLDKVTGMGSMCNAF